MIKEKKKKYVVVNFFFFFAFIRGKHQSLTCKSKHDRASQYFLYTHSTNLVFVGHIAFNCPKQGPKARMFLPENI